MQTLTRNVHAHRLHGRIAFEEKHLHSQTSPLVPHTPPLTPPCLGLSERLHSQGSKAPSSFSVSRFFSSPPLPRPRRRELFPTTSSPHPLCHPSSLPTTVSSLPPPPPPPSSPLCSSSGQRSWQQRSVTLTLKPPAEYSFLRKHALTPCHFFLSS